VSGVQHTWPASAWIIAVVDEVTLSSVRAGVTRALHDSVSITTRRITIPYMNSTAAFDKAGTVDAPVLKGAWQC
jgi:hypothetical protein